MNKRLVVILCCFFLISVVLLGASNSKESGQDIEGNVVQEVTDDVRIIYSNNVINKENKVSSIGIINKYEYIKEYYVVLEGIEDYTGIQYRIDNGELKDASEVIHIGLLGGSGYDGDYKNHNIEFIFDRDIEFKVVVKTNDGESILWK